MTLLVSDIAVCMLTAASYILQLLTLLVSDIAVCTLTAASYLLLLFAGKSAAPQPQPESEGNDPESRDHQTIPETHAG